jgi:hypothetical protein
MTDLRSIARALGGEVSGRQVLAPGPGHSPRDRSLSIRIESGAPSGFVVFSHCGDDPIVCKDYVRERLGLPTWHLVTGRTAALTQPVLADSTAPPSTADR